MRSFYMEWKKMAGRKFFILLVLVLLSSFGISAYHSKKCADRFSDVKEFLPMNAAIVYEECERSRKREKDAVLRSFYQEKASAARDLQTAYTEENIPAVIEATLRCSELQLSSDKYGIILDARSMNEARQKKEVCTILAEKGIKVYHEPMLGEECYYEGTRAVTSFLENYMFLLVPLAAALLCADWLAVERQSGSIKLLLGVPGSRIGILVKKYLAGIGLSLAVLPAGLFGAFFGGMVFSGMGDLRYPVKAEASFFALGAETYISEWQIWIRAGAVCVCAVLFFAALSMFLGVWIKNGMLSLIFGVLLAAGGTVFVRQSIFTAGDFADAMRYLPFAMTDGYAAAMGNMQQRTVDLRSSSLGLAALSASQVQVIKNGFPGAESCVFLILWAVVLFALTAFLFRRKDMV